MKLTTKDVIKVIKENEAEIRKFGVKEIYLFGSVVRGEAKENSDVDFFVVFEESARVGYFKLIELQMFLELKLNTAVDLGTKLHPALRDQVMREALRVA
jgi:predicted nucleotidyltransferase